MNSRQLAILFVGFALIVGAAAKIGLAKEPGKSTKSAVTDKSEPGV